MVFTAVRTGADCKKGLGAVKTAVVSKYRMTNKPAPELPSAYVDSILLPLRYGTVNTTEFDYCCCISLIL